MANSFINKKADLTTTDATGKTLDYTGESDTYAGGESTPGDDTSYSDPYDPGGGE